MDPRFIYSAAASSREDSSQLDSWDLENLKYIRKISHVKNPNPAPQPDLSILEPSYCETISYLSSTNNNESLQAISIENCEGFADISFFMNNPNNNNVGREYIPEPTNIHKNSKNSEIKATEDVDNNSLESAVIIHNNIKNNFRPNFHRPEETDMSIEEFTSYYGNRNITANNLRHFPGEDEDEETADELNSVTTRRPLDTCCQFDVLTIRNESVYAERPASNNGNGNAFNNAGGCCSESSSSGYEEGSHPEDSPPALRSRVSNSTSKSSRKGSNTSASSSSLEENDSAALRVKSKKYFYLGQNEQTKTKGSNLHVPCNLHKETEKSAIIDFVERKSNSEGSYLSSSSETSSVAGRKSSSTKIPRTQASDFIDLRQEFIASCVPGMCAPSNFGMDKQGQLLIDYTPNWKGLEKCIEKLRLSCIH